MDKHATTWCSPDHECITAHAEALQAAAAGWHSERIMRSSVRARRRKREFEGDTLPRAGTSAGERRERVARFVRGGSVAQPKWAR